MLDPDYGEVLQRIQDVYASCSVQEQLTLTKILEEVALKGYSETFERIWLEDFKEVPVSIDRFVCDDYYLGSVNRHGTAVYSFWKDCLRNIFNSGNKYNEIVLSGATRIGKSSTMVIMMAYMLYRLMLYRNPHEYFKKKEVSRFTLAFANLNKELAYGVAYRELNDTLKDCEWFMHHGSVSRSDRNFYYIPEGDKIDIVAGSDASNFLGMQLWACLHGDTQILTAEGLKTLSECSETVQTIFQYDGVNFIPTDALVQCTKYAFETIRVELEDGSIIEGTPDHRIMLADGTYKCLADLTSSDDLLTFNTSTEVDEMNLNCCDRKFHVYEHISPEGKYYIGITSKESPEERWNRGYGYYDNKHFYSAIQKYGWNNFQHNIVASGLTLKEACDMEQLLIEKYDAMNPEHGYNHTTGGNWSTPDDTTRKKLSESVKRSRQDPEVVKKISESLKGHQVSELTRQRKHSAETLANLKGHSSWCKGLTKETDERVKRIADKQRGIPMSTSQKELLSRVQKARYEAGYAPRWINDGEVEKTIQQSEQLPEGFHYGRLSKKDTYIFKGDESKKINHEELDSYIQQGWTKGRPKSVSQSIRNSLQVSHWEYNGLKFERTVDLIAYLNENGYPDIVDSTLTSLYNKGFSNSPKYCTLQDKIKKVMHENKINSKNSAH